MNHSKAISSNFFKLRPELEMFNLVYIYYYETLDLCLGHEVLNMKQWEYTIFGNNPKYIRNEYVRWNF